MPTLTLEKVSVTYLGRRKEEIPALHEVSCVIPSGKCTALMGPSGSGKSTLLLCLAGLLPFDGKIESDGRDIEKTPTSDRQISYVSQEYVLYPHLSVFDNLAFPLKRMGAEPKEIEERVEKMARELGLTALLTRLPRELSGGQQQLLSLGRALIKRPKLLLLDEPLSNLDQPKREKAIALLRRHFEEERPTLVYATHREEEAKALAERLIFLDKGYLQEVREL